MPTLKRKPDVFSFVVGVSGIDVDGADYETLLFEAGCGDSVVFVENGRLLVEFDRESESYDQAVASAKDDIVKAGGTVIFVEAIRT